MLTLQKLNDDVELSEELRLLKIFETLKDARNEIELPLEFLEEELSISHNTAKKYLRRLKSAKVLKFSLKGLFTLNPEVFDFNDVCTPAEINMLKIRYETFKSD